MDVQYSNRLEWAQKNRARKRRVQPIGVWMGRLAGRLTETPQADAGEVARQLSGIVDEDFRTHCRVVLTDRHGLRVCVDHVALVYPMRAKWLRRLGKTARERYWGGKVREVEFVYGTEGATLPRPGDAQYSCFETTGAGTGGTSAANG